MMGDTNPRDGTHPRGGTSPRDGTNPPGKKRSLIGSLGIGGGMGITKDDGIGVLRVRLQGLVIDPLGIIYIIC
jgi:hypothetical protein